ncbi:MAG: 16S rRNA (adenine(1518)-N(6)/adenine(1519)-N(6))-dimethyltransferase RsmA [Bacteroidia bacterium]|nr:16S rRNA (adenine(1518)-N(6)/adenine(1519)-N(6))-dimethyltransferase RsmA [Bacteroidia bacterium]
MENNVRAKKHLGQHFLKDENIARNIVDAVLEEKSEDALIEIGPGTGVLTKYLIEKDNFFALDVDTESIEYLKKTYPKHQSKIIFADFLQEDLVKLTGKQKFNIIGNFPYNISSQIMFKVLENRNNIDFVVGMFQKEVAERIAEKPGTKTYGILSVLLQAFYDISYLFTVSEHVFNPPPKVKSAVIKLKRNNVAKLPCNEFLFVKVVKTTFNQRRKTIRNSIRPIITFAEGAHPLLEKRPEQLSVAEFIELTNFVEAQQAL